MKSSGPAYPANDGSNAALGFYMKHQETFTQISNAINEAFANRRGDDLLLMRVALLALADSIRDGLKQRGVRVEVTD